VPVPVDDLRSVRCARFVAVAVAVKVHVNVNVNEEPVRLT
jgi:hypothetical protein